MNSNLLMLVIACIIYQTTANVARNNEKFIENIEADSKPEGINFPILRNLEENKGGYCLSEKEVRDLMESIRKFCMQWCPLNWIHNQYEDKNTCLECCGKGTPYCSSKVKWRMINLDQEVKDDHENEIENHKDEKEDEEDEEEGYDEEEDYDYEKDRHDKIEDHEYDHRVENKKSHHNWKKIRAFNRI